MKNPFMLCCAMLVLLVFGTYPALADDWADEDTPLSYHVEMLPWEQVNGIIPKKAKFQIIDIESGLNFWVQRRAGSQHADVQPLSKKDTKIMKRIYHNKWSWDRRAIIVVVKDQMIAASMNGMPHGGGALLNGFRGHFCVHFSGSITHKLQNEDPAHKLMIMKAAGKLDDYIHSLGPQELLQTFALGLNMKDIKVLNVIFTTQKHSKTVGEMMRDVQYFSVNTNQNFFPFDQETLLVFDAEFPVQYYSKKNGMVRKDMRFVFTRFSLTEPWSIQQKYIFKGFGMAVPRKSNSLKLRYKSDVRR
ncbi:hypothetical protein [Peribacillus sp. SCS-155]|uniref:hypothetical protein n=1 Tax=Peribacillus sedimenti TaxID=3115297 RepID=UPI00390678B2